MQANRWLSLAFGPLALMAAGQGCARLPNAPPQSAANTGTQALAAAVATPEKKKEPAECFYEVVEKSIRNRGLSILRVDAEGRDEKNQAYIDYLLARGTHFYSTRVTCDPTEGPVVTWMRDGVVEHVGMKEPQP